MAVSHGQTELPATGSREQGESEKPVALGLEWLPYLKMNARFIARIIKDYCRVGPKVTEKVKQ